MVDMDSQTDPGPAPGADPTDQGPRVTAEQVRDFTRLRRSSTDRWVGGVAGGLARHLDVDPTLVRVVLAVLALFGGAGLLVYAAVWLLVPEDGRDRAPLELGPDVAKVVVGIAVVLAALVVLGVPWLGDGGWFPWPLVLVGLGVAWLLTRGRRREADAARAAGRTASSDTDTDTSSPPPADLAGSAPPSAWGPPPPLPPAAPRPRRDGPVLFWPVLAALAVALGVLGTVDVTADVPASAYPALALAVTGLALVVGAFRFRPGGLIALGLVLLPVLAGTALADVARIGGAYGSTTVAPTSVADLRSDYRPENGEFTLDLRDLEPADLAGRDVAVDMGTGQLTVLLPRGLNADISGDVAIGGISIDADQVGGGIGWTEGYTLVDDPDDPSVDLDLALRLGGIEVRTR